MKDLISVIINVYNGEEYIERCIDSVINQTYKKIEIIVINDGSTDNTVNIIKKYNDKRIRLINNKKNLGLSLSRNVGIENSNGKYLYFLDIDDFILNDTIEYLYNLIKKYNVLLSTCECKEIRSFNYTLKHKKEKISIETGKDLLDKVLLSYKRHGSTWNKLYDRSLFDNIRFESRIINDVVVTYKIALKLDKYVYSNQEKYICYRHSDSILGKKEINWCIDLFNASIERYSYIKKIYPNYLYNDLCLCSVIELLYRNNIKEVVDYLNSKDAINLYKKLFSFKILFTKTKFKNKIEMVIFRISPKLLINLVSIYSKKGAKNGKNL